MPNPSQSEIAAEREIKDSLPADPVYFYLHHLVAAIIARHTRHNGKTAEQIAGELEEANQIITNCQVSVQCGKIDPSDAVYKFVRRAMNAEKDLRAAESVLADMKKSLELADELAQVPRDWKVFDKKAAAYICSREPVTPWRFTPPSHAGGTMSDKIVTDSLGIQARSHIRQ